MGIMRINTKKILLAFIAIPLFCNFNLAFAEPSQNQNNLYFSQSDRQNYARAFGFAARGDAIALYAAIGQISDKTLVPILERELLLNQANPEKEKIRNWLLDNTNISNAQAVYELAIRSFPNEEFAQPSINSSRRSFARIRAPREGKLDTLSRTNNFERQAFIQLRASFAANKDAEVIQLALANQNSSNYAVFAWYGGLSAFRIGDFESSLSFFTNAANAQAFDEAKKSAANYWAARAAQKLGRIEIATSFLEQAATQPLSFYGQLALQKLGRWQNLAIPEQRSETQNAREILANSPSARRAIALFDLGLVSDAQNELSLAWNNSPARDDLGYLYIASTLGFRDLFQRISEMSNNAYISANYPIADGLTPQGGSFVLDRALVYAIMRQESRFKTEAISHAGARGLMQLMPNTAAWMTGRPELRTNPELLHNNELNIALGEAYLERIMKMRPINNSLARTIMAYNAGPGALSRWTNSIAMSDDTLMLIEATPVSETREYVKKVMSNLWIYHKRLGQNAPTLEKLAADRIPFYEPQDNPREMGSMNHTNLMR